MLRVWRFYHAFESDLFSFLLKRFQAIVAMSCVRQGKYLRCCWLTEAWQFYYLYFAESFRKFKTDTCFRCHFCKDVSHGSKDLHIAVHHIRVFDVGTKLRPTRETLWSVPERYGSVYWHRSKHLLRNSSWRHCNLSFISVPPRGASSMALWHV